MEKVNEDYVEARCHAGGEDGQDENWFLPRYLYVLVEVYYHYPAVVE
jgi:hypothetical protein